MTVATKFAFVLRFNTLLSHYYITSIKLFRTAYIVGKHLDY